MTIFVQDYFWTHYSFQWIYVFSLLLISHSWLVSHELCSVPSTLYFFSKFFFAILFPFLSHINFRILIISTKKYYEYFNLDCNKTVDQIGENWFLDKIDSSNLWEWLIFPFIYIFAIYHQCFAIQNTAYRVYIQTVYRVYTYLLYLYVLYAIINGSLILYSKYSLLIYRNTVDCLYWPCVLGTS